MKRTLTIGVLVFAVVGLAVVAVWAYQNQIWLRDDYTSGYKYGSAQLDEVSGVDSRRERGAACWERVQAHSTDGPPRVVFQAGCTDAGSGRDARPEDAGGFVSDSLGLWGPFG